MPSLRSLASMRLRCGTLRPSVSLITSCEIGSSNALLRARPTSLSRAWISSRKCASRSIGVRRPISTMRSAYAVASLHREPAQRQRELRPPVAGGDEGIERADLQLHVGERDDREGRPVEEAAGQADDVARHQDVDDLALAVAQHLVAGRHAVLDEAELAVGIAVDHEVAALLDRAFALDQRAQRLDVVRRQVDEPLEPRHERAVPSPSDDLADRSRHSHPSGPLPCLCLLIWINNRRQSDPYERRTLCLPGNWEFQGGKRDNENRRWLSL